MERGILVLGSPRADTDQSKHVSGGAQRQAADSAAGREGDEPALTQPGKRTYTRHHPPPTHKMNKCSLCKRMLMTTTLSKRFP